MSRRMISAPAGESYMRWCTSFTVRKPSSAIPSTSGAVGVALSTTFCTYRTRTGWCLRASGACHVRPVVGELLPGEAGRPPHERDPRDRLATPIPLGPLLDDVRLGVRGKQRVLPHDRDGGDVLLPAGHTLADGQVQVIGVVRDRTEKRGDDFHLAVRVEPPHGTERFRDQRRLPRAPRRAARPRDEALRRPQRARRTSSRCSRATSGSSRSSRSRSTRYVWADTAQPALRRHRRPVQEVGRRQRRRVLPVRADRPRAHLPGAGHAGRRRLPLAHGVRRARRRPLLGADRRHRQRPRSLDIAADGTFEFVLGPRAARRRRRVAPARARRRRARSRATTSSTPCTAGASSGTSRPIDPPATVPPGRRRSRPPVPRRASRGCASRPRSCRSRSASRTRSTSRTRCRQQTFGWAAGDAAYAMGSFDLADDEALVIRGRSPECAFWNLCLWNPFLHTYNYDYERVTINGGQVQLRGRRLVDDRGRRRAIPGHPNWVSTAGPPARAHLVPLVLPGRDARATDDARRQRPLTFWEAKRSHSDRFAAENTAGPISRRAQRRRSAGGQASRHERR